MKKIFIKIFLIAILLLLLATVHSQEITTNGSIFPGFTKGKVYFQSGAVIGSLLNYDFINKQILFKQGEVVLALGFPETTDSVVIENRTFVNYKQNEFFEKISPERTVFYIQYDTKLISEGREVAYGGISQVSSAKTINSLSSLDGGQTSQLTHLSDIERFNVKLLLTFWIKQNGRFVNISSRKQIMKAFPEKGHQLKEYLSNHKMNFATIEDIKALLDFCYSCSL